MKRIYHIIEELFWWLDCVCHAVIEWANYKCIGKTISEQWDEMISEVENG